MKLRSTAALVVAVFALSACGADSASTVAVVATTASSQSTESQSGSDVDNFVAKTISGETFELSNALAQKPVVLWFWAPG
jgi:ABC-type glycerol-3-phosphate transport system substrate-binding protein